jgi:hypothetical protein
MERPEDDINDLLRKAADEYSPKESESQWEKILVRIGVREEEKKPTVIPWMRLGYLISFLIIGIAIGWMYLGVHEKIPEGSNTTPGPKDHVTQNESGNNTRNNNSNNNKQQTHLIAPRHKTTQNKITPGSNTHVEIKTIFNMKKETLSGVNSVEHSINIDNYNNNQLLYPVDSLNDHKQSSIKNKQIQRGKAFYFGVASAIDYSNVKSSSVNQAGYAAGVIAGYSFNNKIDLETGLIFNKRNYFSEGRYFNMEKVRDAMPPDLHIISLNTTSSVVEIPLKVKYNFLRSARSTVFATTGMSSYLITFQRNDYNASMNGVGEQFSGMYHKNEFLLPAVINVSAGYNYTFSDHLNIRAEPFLKIPLKGMGIGNLPVTSAGIQLAVTRKFN